MSSLSSKQNTWLEPFQNWLKVAQGLDKIVSDSDLFAKKVCAKEISGSHLLLGEKTLSACAPDSDSFLADSLADSGGNHWDALRASRIWASEKPLKKSLSLILVRGRGIEPPCLSALPPQGSAYTVSPPARAIDDIR